MKHVFILVLSLLLSTACDQSEESAEEGDNLKGTMSYVIDGKLMEPTSVSGKKTVLSTSSSIEIKTDKSVAGTTVQLFLKGDLAPNSFSLDSPYNYLYFTQSTGTTYQGNAEKGTVKITEHDLAAGHIVGTFNFTMKPFNAGDPKLNVTDGKFDVWYNTVKL